jgi:protein-L-isoaspartate(D-aspartate) O-methyltransferase
MQQDYRPIHSTMKDLCAELVNKNWIQCQKVYDVMMSVDRADFAPTNPYENNPQCIGYNVVISAPLLHSYCLEALKDYLIEGSTALDIGFGSGYLTVAMSKMMNDKGCVIGIEHIKDLYDWGINNISKHHKNLIDNKSIELIFGDGREGYKKKAPFKCIHVGAAAMEPPKEFIEQLDFGGRLVMPLGPPGDQYIYFIDKDKDGKISFFKGLSVRYVPLTSPENQIKNVG